MQQLDFWIRKRASQSPNKIALIQIETGEAWTYEQLMKHTYWWTEQFTKHKLQRGDRIALLMENSIESFAILFACRLNELIYVPLNTKLTKAELQAIVADCTPSLLVADDVHTERAEELAEGCLDRAESPGLGGMEQADGPDEGCAEREDDLTVGDGIDTGVANKLAGIRVVAAKSEMVDTGACNMWQDEPMLPWLIIYTGGTTGKAKGVVLSYEAVTANAINTVISWGLNDADCTLNYMPLFHTGGINALALPVLMVGGTVVIGQKFDPERAVRAIDEYKTTISLFVPTMYQLMTQTTYFEQSTFPTVKVFLSGGAPCPKPIYERFNERGLKFKEGYGLTEAGPNNFFIDCDVAMTKKGAVGKSMLFNEVQVMNEKGEPCSEGEVGELWLKGSHVFRSYWNNEQETEATFHNGWLKTGDLAMFDEDGDFYIVGRKKEMIITGGENVYPQEVEQCLIMHPAVREVTVIGVPEEKWGECVVAFVVLKNVGDYSDEALAAELMEHCKKKLANYKVPKRLNFAEELPKTVVGKIDKKQLQQVPPSL